MEPIPKQRLRGRKIVDEHHGAPAIPAKVKAQRRPLPVDPALARIAGIEHPFAKAQAAEDRSRGFFAHDVAVGLPPAPDGFLDRQGEPFRGRTEKVVARGDQLVSAEGLKPTPLIGRRIDLSRCRGLVNGAHGQASGERQDKTVRAHQDHFQKVLRRGLPRSTLTILLCFLPLPSRYGLRALAYALSPGVRDWKSSPPLRRVPVSRAS